MGKILKKYPNLFILSDEIYEHINYGIKSFSIASIPELYDRTIKVNGVAKAFAMTGWRIGYIVPEWIAKAWDKVQGQITSGANCIAQRATIAALILVEKIKYIITKKRRDMIVNLLSDIKGFNINVPEELFMFFLTYSLEKN